MRDEGPPFELLTVTLKWFGLPCKTIPYEICISQDPAGARVDPQVFDVIGYPAASGPPTTLETPEIVDSPVFDKVIVT